MATDSSFEYKLKGREAFLQAFLFLKGAPIMTHSRVLEKKPVRELARRNSRLPVPEMSRAGEMVQWVERLPRELLGMTPRASPSKTGSTSGVLLQ